MFAALSENISNIEFNSGIDSPPFRSLNKVSRDILDLFSLIIPDIILLKTKNSVGIGQLGSGWVVGRLINRVTSEKILMFFSF